MRLFILLLAIFASIPAMANDIDAAKRGVARIIVIAQTPDGRSGVSFGSGFAVDPDSVVTNDHVVRLAKRFPRHSAILVVPSEGSKPYPAQLRKTNSSKDLALLDVTGSNFAPLTIFGGQLSSGDDVTALGYPGNVDRATIRNAREYITPREPTLSEGSYSNVQSIDGIEALVHSANIARGNSGGPLVDECGRILGVNTFQTGNSGGDSSFAFASSAGELASFLRSAGQDFKTISDKCVTAEEFAAQEANRKEQDKLRREAEAARQAESEAREDAAVEREEAEERRAAERSLIAEREEKLFLAIGLLIAGALLVGCGIGFAGQTGARKNIGYGMLAAAVLLIAIGIAVFLMRPSMDNAEIEARVRVQSESDADKDEDKDSGLGTIGTSSKSGAIEASNSVGSGRASYICRIDRAASRITTSEVDDVEIAVSDDGCVNRRKQYAEDGQGDWSRILVPQNEETVSILTFDPDNARLTTDNYLLGLNDMKAARKLRSNIRTDKCTRSNSARKRLAERQQDIRDILPARPNERLVYKCSRS